MSIAFDPTDPAPADDEGIVISHAGDTLFAYAPTRAALDAATDAIRRVLEAHDVPIDLIERRWDEEQDEWVPLDRPAGHGGARGPEVTRTMVATAGRAVERSFVESILADARRRGLQCSVFAGGGVP
ncbi:MAG TPA: hypothetical protein VHX88_06290 [Solirubrobacteraceae bacterium]|jgi:hypothetical protein|nr:hypothetical protein [Solirubrobacteraceae bacterium]